LGVDRIWAAGHRGESIVIGIVDCGITAIGRSVQPGEVASVPRVVGGFPAADWGTTSAAWGGHGNMCATDALGMAPRAQLWDIRIAEQADPDPAVNFAAIVSNAIAGFTAAIENFLQYGTPQILSNSWGLYDSQNGLAFATDPTHPFTRKVEEALDAGILMLFAAGNCGADCPSTRCGSSVGPGASILGPNGHARVMTVGAANRNDIWCGFSSQGPAVLPPKAAKPDFCATSHFAGFFPRSGSTVPFDGGTSAATAVTAGIVALLKQKQPALTQDQAKTALGDTAKDIRAPGRDSDSGAGVIRAKAAYDTI
jgi:serine protease AprX